MSLREEIEREIQLSGPIPFSRYMQLCLYHPELGYYSRNKNQFGKTGDFYTSSDVHAVFGRLLSRQFEEMWRALGSPSEIDIVEFGPGRGLFARDVLDWSEKKFPEFFRALRYNLVEGSHSLRLRLRENLNLHVDRGKARLLDFGLQATFGEDELKPYCEQSLTDAIFFANEFFDALPVEVLTDGGELRININCGRFIETWHAPSAEELEYLDRVSIHPKDGDRVEAGLVSQTYIQQMARKLNRGFLVVIDYGYTRDELLAGRHRGTIMTYRQHSASPNPYEAPGEQDITAHVNFTALAAVAQQNEITTQKLLTQSQFLLGVGEKTQFSDAFEDCRVPQEQAKVALQLKHLVTPVGMGETFHVLVGSKGVDLDVVSQLSGLSFGHYFSRPKR